MTGLLTDITNFIFLCGTHLSGVYKIKSKIKPDRIYIGSSNDILQRWNRHLCNLKHNKHSSKKLQNHYNKYGKQDLLFSILFVCNDDLIECEQFFMDSYKPWFNNVLTAGSNRGHKFNADYGERISKNQKGRIPWNKGLTKETDIRVKINTENAGLTRRGQPSSMKGKHHTEETKNKLRKPHNISKQGRLAIRESLLSRKIWDRDRSKDKRKPRTQEHNKKIGDGNRNKIRTPQTIQKLKDAWILRKLKKGNNNDRLVA